ncbi:UNVERIFIED_CONTAM: hypothetical protein Sradi_3922900 [Sesamum radiatum]|uniref:DUF642 domain-containing protein n=1 Tax=Sesamum radiatum TaxID=300843 RepID=A0AAW2PHZ1_SESRA
MKGTKVTDPHAIPSWEISGFVEYITSGHKQGDMLLVVPEALGRPPRRPSIIKTNQHKCILLSFSAARELVQKRSVGCTQQGAQGLGRFAHTNCL